MSDGVLSLRNAPESTRALLEEIGRIASDAVNGKVEQQDAVDAIAALAPSLAPFLKMAKSPNLPLYLLMLLWFIVEMTKALNPNGGKSPTVIIENRPAIVNQVTVDQRVTPEAKLAPRDGSIHRDDGKHSKRKERRLRGKAKEKARRAVGP